LRYRDLCDLNAMLAGLWVGVCWVVDVEQAAVQQQ
jgi:hypothetical protein